MRTTELFLLLIPLIQPSLQADPNDLTSHVNLLYVYLSLHQPIHPPFETNPPILTSNTAKVPKMAATTSPAPPAPSAWSS